MLARSSFVAAAFAAIAVAQSTWIVDAGGGPGVHFLDLPSAVASTSVVDGDTILVQLGPFHEGGAPFTTNKGITIVGVSALGYVPIGTTPVAPVAVVGLPAGRTFRMVGFHRVSDGEVNVRLQNCAGAVHLENITAREPDWFFPTTPAIDIVDCASVTLRGVENFGAPAVRVQNSTVSLVSCRLGETSIGLGGGRALEAIGSTVSIVQPRFDALGGMTVMETTNCDVRIGGDGSAVLSVGAWAASPAVPIVANGGTLAIDPAVPLTTYPLGMPGISGTATVTVGSVPASWTTGSASPGQPLGLATTASPGSVVFQALGPAGPLAPTPLGLLGIDPLAPVAFFAPAIAPAAGHVPFSLSVPASLPPGTPVATQAVVWNGSVLRLGEPVAFVLH